MSAALTKQDFADYIVPTYKPAILMKRGMGCRLWDDAGQEYLDFAAGISVCNLGHCHPGVTAAIARQAATLVHTSNVFMNENAPELAKQIVRHSFDGKVFFSNSGAEANEGMIKAARRWGWAHGGRHDIICLHDSFHGRTLAALAATGRAKYREGFGPDMAGFTHVPANDLAAVEAAITEKTVAIMCESILGEGGVLPLTDDYLRALRKLCDDRNLLLLADEVQAGMGRTGKWWGWQHSGITPDIMSFAKGIGNGFPLGGFVLGRHLDGTLPYLSHGTTYGGNALATAAGLAVMSAMENEGVIDNVHRVSARIFERLNGLQERFPHLITEVRGRGLMIGIEITKTPADLVAAARAKHLLILAAGDKALRLLPPLNISLADADKAIDVLEGVLTEAAKN